MTTTAIEPTVREPSCPLCGAIIAWHDDWGQRHCVRCQPPRNSLLVDLMVMRDRVEMQDATR